MESKSGFSIPPSKAFGQRWSWAVVLFWVMGTKKGATFTITPLSSKWSRWWESNSRSQLGRLKFYHWTTPAVVERGRFELPNPKELSYSQPRLATSLSLQKKCDLTITWLHSKWSRWWESNSRSQLGRLKFYHWTTPASGGERQIRTAEP